MESVVGGVGGVSGGAEKWLLPLFDELDCELLQFAKAIDIEGKSYAVEF